jgi:excisionase family DNA binding protein
VSPLLDAAAAAIYLDTTERHLRRLTADYELPYVRVGRKVRFQTTDLDQWLTTRRVTAVHVPVGG